MNRPVYLGLLILLALIAVPSFASNGNIYLTGHDLDFHCALKPAPTQCNAFKIAVALARAGAPNPNLPVLFLDQGMSSAAAGAHDIPAGTSLLALAAQKIGLTAFEVVDPTSTEFTGGIEGPAPLPLITSSYSAIVIASDISCGGESISNQCDNTSVGESNINSRSEDIAAFFGSGGGLVYLSGADSFTYYGSVPAGYGVVSTSTIGPYTLTAQGRSLGLIDDDANCCTTHNSFTSAPIITAPTLESASNPNLIAAETDGNGEGGANDETLYAVGVAAGTQAAVLTFTPTQTSQTATFNCTSGLTPCPDADAHSMKFSVGTVSQPFTIVVTATEVHGNGICESGDPNDATDYDCRFVNFFGQPTAPAPNVKVPFCYPYSHGNCVFYAVTGAPPVNGFYSGGVREYIAWNNLFVAPLGYLNTPHMYDDPSDDANACACYPTTTPGYPYSPEDKQYVFDITTFFNDGGGQVGKDPGTGGRTPTFNEFGIAFPLATGDVYRWLSPLSGTTTTAKKGTIPIKFQLRDATGSVVSNAVTPPNFVTFAVLDSNGVSQPVQSPGGSPTVFVYDSKDQQYHVNLSTTNYTIGMTYTIVVNSNLFSQQQAKFKIK